MISVIIPVYNTEKYLERCLDSVVKQQFKDIEIICVDDGSTDSSLSILRNYANKNSKIKIIHQENKGLSAARNTGLENSKGEYVLFVDSDDELEINAIDNLYQGILIENVDAVLGRVKLIFEEYTEKKIEYESYFSIKYSGVQKLNDDIINNFYVCAWGILYKREVIDALKLRFPDGLFFEDNFWHWSYFTSIKKINFLNKYIYKYYIRSGSIMSQTFSIQEGRAVHQLYIVEAICDFWKKLKIFDAHKLSAEYLLEKMFFEAIKCCPKYEKSLIAYECCRIIKKFNLDVHNNKILNKIRIGDLDFLYFKETNESDNFNKYILFLRVIKFIDKILPPNSGRRKFIYMICRRIYKFVFRIR